MTRLVKFDNGFLGGNICGGWTAGQATEKIAPAKQDDRNCKYNGEQDILNNSNG